MKKVVKYVYSVFESKVAFDFMGRFSGPRPKAYGFFSESKMPRPSEEQIKKADAFFQEQREKRRLKELEGESISSTDEQVTTDNSNSSDLKKEEDENQESEI